jgi:hypothetical protein
MDDAAAPTANWCQDELVSGIAKLTGRLVVRRKVALSVSTDADPKGAGPVAPAVAAGWNKGRGQIASTEFGYE